MTAAEDKGSMDYARKTAAAIHGAPYGALSGHRPERRGPSG